MREAIGGDFLFRLIIIFFIIYISLMSIGINYAITFRAKNQIVDILERYETYDAASEKINDYISTVSYFKFYANESNQSYPMGPNCLNQTDRKGYCVQEILANKDNPADGYYYRVTTYMTFDFPIISNIFYAPVYGETTIIRDLGNL